MMYVCLTSDDVCLSVAYIGPKSKTEGPRKTKLAQRYSLRHVHVRDSGTTFKVKGQLAGGGGMLWRPAAQLEDARMLTANSLA